MIDDRECYLQRRDRPNKLNGPEPWNQLEVFKAICLGLLLLGFYRNDSMVIAIFKTT